LRVLQALQYCGHLAAAALGGRIFLHEKQDEAAWHGGTITGYRRSDEEGRVVFTFHMDGPFRIKCAGGWGQEKAIVRF
jgi:hypothetical protein